MLTRRAIFKGMATGMLGLSGGSLLSARARASSLPDADVLTASHWGAFHARRVDGRIASLQPWKGDPQPAPVLDGVLDVVYSPTRIKYPMVRRAFLEHGPGSDQEDRGEGDFVRVTWDQALDLVARELRRVDQAYGPSGTFAGSYGWKSPGKLHNCQTLLRRMLGLKGGYVVTSGTYSTGAINVIMPYVIGSQTSGAQQTVWPVVVENTELMVFWAADPVNNCQIGSIIPDHGTYPGLEALKKKGTKVICIDPVRTATCEELKAEWLAPRPQTDVAMMLGIAHTLYVEKLHDVKFLADYTTGFDKFVPYLIGESGGPAKTAEWAADICGIPAATIQDLARRFAKNRTMLACGWSVQRQHHGEQVHWMLVTLASMLGQIGLPGGGFGLSYHYANGGSPTADSPVLTGITDQTKATVATAWPAGQGASSIPVARVVEMLENPGKPFDFNGTRPNYPDVKLAYWTGGNPFAHHQDRNKMVKAWQNLETFIVQDVQWTATARYADYPYPYRFAISPSDTALIFEAFPACPNETIRATHTCFIASRAGFR